MMFGIINYLGLFVCFLVEDAASFSSISKHSRIDIARWAVPLAQDSSSASTLKENLVELISTAPQTSLSSPKLTSEILQAARLLEKECPTHPSDVLQSLAGPWELLWTAQDPLAPESNQLLRSWINPLENQSYSNNPGQSNPILPRELQDRLERAGITTSSVAEFRSTQTIDLANKQVINVVVVDATVPLFGKQRATVRVLVNFEPNRSNPRQVDVKFDSCRFSIQKLVEFTIPLGIVGPRGWLRTVYIDDTMRITRGHKGSVFILTRPASRVLASEEK